jgi:hypothetical protein
MVWFVEDENRMIAMITDTKAAALEFADFNDDYHEWAIYSRDVFTKDDVTNWCESKNYKKGYNDNAHYDMEHHHEDET